MCSSSERVSSRWVRFPVCCVGIIARASSVSTAPVSSSPFKMTPLSWPFFSPSAKPEDKLVSSSKRSSPSGEKTLATVTSSSSSKRTSSEAGSEDPQVPATDMFSSTCGSDKLALPLLSPSSCSSS
ncbi:hypothetical protein PF008_g30008 [Phytophthora fragariae]|uniref:Uncharacterized protein n=1 Tax=Phytophthora fragariae TaxID=53985 RepID=A0A6G0Q7G3_9STRA|nr:hypothetical protein PF008_g30008 [Phytophthora fragariae]